MHRKVKLNNWAIVYKRMQLHLNTDKNSESL
jgi:hypothetical protein